MRIVADVTAESYSTSFKLTWNGACALRLRCILHPGEPGRLHPLGANMSVMHVSDTPD